MFFYNINITFTSYITFSFYYIAFFYKIIMEKEISSGTMLGIVLIALAAVIGLLSGCRYVPADNIKILAVIKQLPGSIPS